MPRRKPRILCLDDQSEHLRLRKIFLEQFWCEVTAVEDAEACLRVADKAEFDLALLDYHLGSETNGEDVARELRSRFPNMPLVMLTGDPHIPESAQQSVDVVIVKGQSNPGDLLNLIQELAPDCSVKPLRKPIIAETISCFKLERLPDSE